MLIVHLPQWLYYVVTAKKELSKNLHIYVFYTFSEDLTNLACVRSCHLSSVCQ